MLMMMCNQEILTIVNKSFQILINDNREPSRVRYDQGFKQQGGPERLHN